MWTQSYSAGTIDSSGSFMGGTELMKIVQHKGVVFASVGYWEDVAGTDPRPGSQILRTLLLKAPRLQSMYYVTVAPTHCSLGGIMMSSGT